MKPLTEFLPEVLPSVIGCPQPLALNAIRNSVNEFLSGSNLVEQTIEFAIEPGVDTYPIEDEQGTVATRFLRAYFNDRSSPVIPVSPSALNDHAEAYRAATGVPRWSFVDGRMLVVLPVPVAAGTIYADFAYNLSRSATRVPDEVLDWAETIAAGALRRLLILPGVAWTNAELAAYYAEQFRAGVDQARIEKIKGATMESMRVASRAFQ